MSAGTDLRSSGQSFLTGLARRAAGRRAQTARGDLKPRPEPPAAWLPEPDTSQPSSLEANNRRAIVPLDAGAPGSARRDGPSPEAAAASSPHDHAPHPGGAFDRPSSQGLASGGGKGSDGQLEPRPSERRRTTTNRAMRDTGPGATEDATTPPPATSRHAGAALEPSTSSRHREVPLSRLELREERVDREPDLAPAALGETASDLGQPAGVTVSLPTDSARGALGRLAARARLEPAPCPPDPVDRFFRGTAAETAEDAAPRVEVYIDRVEVAPATPPPSLPVPASPRPPRGERGFAAVERARRHLGRRWY